MIKCTFNFFKLDFGITNRRLKNRIPVYNIIGLINEWSRGKLFKLACCGALLQVLNPAVIKKGPLKSKRD